MQPQYGMGLDTWQDNGLGGLRVASGRDAQDARFLALERCCRHSTLLIVVNLNLKHMKGSTDEPFRLGEQGSSELT